MIHSCGIIVFDMCTNCVLCVRSYKNWDFPKGKIILNETFEMAAIRELKEETSLTINDFEFIKNEPFTSKPYGSGNKKKQAHYFLAKRTSLKNPYLPYCESIGRRENDEYRWININNLISIMPYRLTNIINELNKYILENVLNES